MLGAIADRLRQPRLLGHMIAGVVLGPSALAWVSPGQSLIAESDYSAALAKTSDLALFFVVAAAGLELRLEALSSLLRGKGFPILLIGFFVPAAAAAALTWMVGLDFVAASVVILCVSVTALPVALQILKSLGLLNTEVARVAIMGAVLSDVIVLIALGIITETTQAAAHIAAHSAPQAAAHGLVHLVGNDGALWPALLGWALLKLAALLALAAAAHFFCGFLGSVDIHMRYSPTR